MSASSCANSCSTICLRDAFEIVSEGAVTKRTSKFGDPSALLDRRPAIAVASFTQPLSGADGYSSIPTTNALRLGGILPLSHHLVDRRPDVGPCPHNSSVP